VDPEDIKSLSLWAIWNCSKGAGLPWANIRLWGTNGPFIRPRCIGTVKTRTQMQIIINPSGRTMALWLPQPRTEMSTRNIFWRTVRRADNLTTLMCRLSRNPGCLNLLEISRPVQAWLGEQLLRRTNHL
jgi:hypothetical protein